MKTKKILCGCCHRPGEPGHIVHPHIGQLCKWCARTFDHALDRDGRRAQPNCPTCWESPGSCPAH